MTTSNNKLETKLGLRPNNVVVDEEKKVDEKGVVGGDKMSVCVVDSENYMETVRRLGMNSPAAYNTIKRLGRRFNRVVFVFKRSFNALGNVFNRQLDGIEYVRLVPAGSDKKMCGAKKSYDDAFVLCLAAKLEAMQFDVTIYSDDSFESNRCGNNGVVYGWDAHIHYFSKDKISTAFYVGYGNVFSPKNEFTLDILLSGMSKVVGLSKIVFAK